MKKTLYAVLFIMAFMACSPKDGLYTFHIYTTNDVHGCYFDSLYAGSGTKESLLAVSAYVDSVRNAVGKKNVLLIDAGDGMQGDNAAYYFNYIDTLSEHLFVRMAEYMDYDAVTVGNHDIETGHPVYDRVKEQSDVPFLASNAIRNDNGKSYFQDYTILKRHGFKIAVIGFTNPNIKNWLSKDLWSGITFRSLIPFVQEKVDVVIAREKPDAVIVAIHSGTGKGDGNSIENQGLDLFETLKGVDFVICAHDHSPVTFVREGICLINSGSHCRNIGHGVLEIKVKDGRCVEKSVSADLIPVDKTKVDEEMKDVFRTDYEAVKAFTLKPVGELKEDMLTRESYRGMCSYMNFLHTVCLESTSAQVSFAAPLTFDGRINAGTLVFNDLFTIYPYENQLFVVKMTGLEIKDCLEYSYETWINTIHSSKEHLLKIGLEPDLRTGLKKWSFVNRAYNFDSAGGLNYTVDVTKPFGQRVAIASLADGSPFSPDSTYKVAMTSYRANGGGSIMCEGAGIDTDRIEERIVGKYPEIRNIIYDYLAVHGTVDPDVIGNPSVIGNWSFIPAGLVIPALERDTELLFCLSD